jgi:hypothetical protein
VDNITLDEAERRLADELCERLARRHAFGKRATVELRVEELRVVEVFCHLRIARGRDESALRRGTGGHVFPDPVR